MRKSNFFLLYLTGNLLVLFVLFIHAVLRDHSCRTASAGKQRPWLKRLDLTDLCLFTEASYTRHLTQADLNTPFQDCPLCLEHFPSGSIFTAHGNGEAV